MDRVASITHFRAAGAWLDWPVLLRRRIAQLGGLAEEHRELMDELGRAAERLQDRREVRLVWACSPELGVPHRAFTVWQRSIGRATQEVEWSTAPMADGQLVTWDGTEAVLVQMSCTVDDPGRAVGLYLLRGGGISVKAAVAATATNPGGRSNLILQARCGAATSAVLVNARVTGVLLLPLQEAVQAEDWVEVEQVGLPVRDQLRDYATDPQGLVDQLVDPAEAALGRLERGGTPLGWWPLTETARLAPPWSPADPAGLVGEVQSLLLPEVDRLYSAGLPEPDQVLLNDHRDVDPPSQDGRLAQQRATADISPLATLLLAAGTDPALGLALGFGTAYPPELLLNDPAEVEWLVTAPYRHSPVGDDVELAAYVPPVPAHTQLDPVVDLQAGRAALLPPLVRDGAHRESVELSFRGREGLATLTDPVALALAAFGPGDAHALSRLAERPNGGPHLRALAPPVLRDDPDAPPPPPGRDRPRLVDADLALPLEGPVTRGYAVAQVNLFGLWSRWEDVQLTTSAPVVLPPRVGRLELTARYTSGPVCPSALLVDVAVDWTERSPATVSLVALLYPMPAGSTPPPAGATAASPAPGDGHRVTAELTFGVAGSPDVPTGTGTTVSPLAEDGSVATGYGAELQGRAARSYRLQVATPDLDFGAVSRWGVQVWVQQTARGIVTPSVWSPLPAPDGSPATAVVGSPVPAVPVPPPLPPGVPLGSTPDAHGCSHVRVAWTGLGSAQVDRVVVWEASETTLRHRLAPGSTVDRSLQPGWRLQQLRDLYDAAPASSRPLAFRRLVEVPAAPGAADVALPRGTEDIHALLVTAVTTTGLESPWPQGTDSVAASVHLQTFMAPRLRRPGVPAVRPAVLADGSVQVRLEAASAVPVTAFEVFATRSAAAAREHLTMGPPAATVTASATARTDTVTGEPVYKAVWTGGLPPSWDAWRLRAVAVPEPTVDADAVRGQVSAASDVVSLAVRPTGPPDLRALAAEVVGDDHRGVLLRTATTAPDRAAAAGSHRVVVTVAGVEAPAVALEATALVPGASTPPATAAGPVVQRLPRSAGRTELLVWTERSDPAAELPVAVRLVDPLGRAREETLVVPGWVDPVPDLTLSVVDAFRVMGRGWVLEVTTSARADAEPPWELRVVATAGRRLPWERWIPNPSLRATFLLPDIPKRRRPVPPRTPGIAAVRTDEADGTRVTLWIPSARVDSVTLQVQHRGLGEALTIWRP